MFHAYISNNLTYRVLSIINFMHIYPGMWTMLTNIYKSTITKIL